MKRWSSALLMVRRIGVSSICGMCCAPSAYVSMAPLSTWCSMRTSSRDGRIAPASLGCRGPMHLPTLRTNTRSQRSLESLLQDKSDPYLCAIQDLNMEEVLQIIRRGPAPKPAEVLRSHAIKQETTPLRTKSATSTAEAVLQSLHAEGLRRLEEEEAATAATTSADDDTAAELKERVTAHVFDGLCATIAVLHASYNAAKEDAACVDLPAAISAGTTALKELRLHQANIDARRWAHDFEPEMQELVATLGALGVPAAELQ